MPHLSDLPMQALGLVKAIRDVIQHTLSRDVDSDVTPGYPNGAVGGFMRVLASQVPRITENASFLFAAVRNIRDNGMFDDKSDLPGKAIALEASLPTDSTLLEILSKTSVKQLWDGLSHPPLSYLGDEARFRTADGSHNNRSYPSLGQAGSPYARTVTPQIPRTPSLPDAGLIFDEIMARTGPAREHPTQISSMLFYFASVIIHDLFRTNHTDPTISDTSSYLDLAPLYGSSEKQQSYVRAMKDGLLKPDVFAEYRLLGFPPGVAALLIAFNRFHNFVAGQLAEINEGGRFALKARLTDEEVRKYKTAEGKRDNDLFQTARLITCGLYVNIIINDYVRTALNLNHTTSEWSLGSRNSFAAFGKSSIPEGVGNQVSVEFNLIYRWHSAISVRDENWTEELMKGLLGGVDPKDATLAQTMVAFQAFLSPQNFPPDKPEIWTFGGLVRQDDHTFKDEDLMDILSSSTEDLAGGFGARNVPIAMRAIEMLGIEQARSWNVATLNEFRKYFGLVPHKTFADISSDPDVASSLQALYGDPNHVELYPGIVAEDAQHPRTPGAGLCSGTTIIRCILSDAVALVRGDRFFTVDWTPANVTNWGFNEVAADSKIAGGAVVHKLLMRAFPKFYTETSAYAFFPFTVPKATEAILKDLKMDKKFDFARPDLIPEPTSITTWKGLTEVLGDQVKFKVPWGPHMGDLGGSNFMLAHDDTPPTVMTSANQKAHVGKALYCPAHWDQQIKAMYEEITMRVVHERSRKLRSGYLVDLVADIANLTHATAVAQLYHIPLKTKEHVVGAFTPQEIYTLLTATFAYVFTDDDRTKGFALRQAAQEYGPKIGIVIFAVVALQKFQTLNSALEWLGVTENDSNDYGTKLIERLCEGGLGAQEVAAIIVPTAGAAVTNLANGLTNLIDLFLTEEYKSHWTAIQALAKSDDPASFAKLKKYTMEGFRLRPPVPRILRHVEALSTTIDSGSEEIVVGKDTMLYLDVVSASMDETVFPNPHDINLERDEKKYINLGWGPHSCVGEGIVWVAMAAQLRVFGRLKNLRRAPGPEGHLKTRSLPNNNKQYMKADWSDWVPYPTTMKIMFDGFDFDADHDDETKGH